MVDSRRRPSNFAWLGAVVVVSVGPFNHHQGTNSFSIDDQNRMLSRLVLCHATGGTQIAMCSCLGCMHSWGFDLPTGLSVRLWRNTLHSRDSLMPTPVAFRWLFILDMYKRCYVNASRTQQQTQTLPDMFKHVYYQ